MPFHIGKPGSFQSGTTAHWERTDVARGAVTAPIPTILTKGVAFEDCTPSMTGLRQSLQACRKKSLA